MKTRENNKVTQTAIYTVHYLPSDCAPQKDNEITIFEPNNVIYFRN